jgi:hypothetical protein
MQCAFQTNLQDPETSPRRNDEKLDGICDKHHGRPCACLRQILQHVLSVDSRQVAKIS